ncbi:MAG: DUF4114 domain-containing protein, partial [Cyanobacteria bacterium P01_A01_bin.83]
AEADADTESTAEADTDTDTDADADVDTDTDAEAETDTESTAEADTDTDTDADADVDTDTDAEAETDTESTAEADTDTDTDADADVDTDTDAEAETDTESTAESDTDTDADSSGDSILETIDLTDLGDQTIQFTVDREAGFDNSIGFYEVNEDGSVVDPLSGETIAIGDAGYRDAVIANSLDFTLATPDGETTELTTELSGGTQYASFIIANGTIDQLLDSDSSNDPQIYFGSASANPDNFDHIIALGDNSFGYEDIGSSGDADFNDIVVDFEFV